MRKVTNLYELLICVIFLTLDVYIVSILLSFIMKLVIQHTDCQKIALERLIRILLVALPTCSTYGTLGHAD
jgi:type III secretory pathway component EscS